MGGELEVSLAGVDDHRPVCRHQCELGDEFLAGLQPFGRDLDNFVPFSPGQHGEVAERKDQHAAFVGDGGQQRIFHLLHHDGMQGLRPLGEGEKRFSLLVFGVKLLELGDESVAGVAGGQDGLLGSPKSTAVKVAWGWGAKRLVNGCPTPLAEGRVSAWAA